MGIFQIKPRSFTAESKLPYATYTVPATPVYSYTGYTTATLTALPSGVITSVPTPFPEVPKWPNAYPQEGNLLKNPTFANINSSNWENLNGSWTPFMGLINPEYFEFPRAELSQFGPGPVDLSQTVKGVGPGRFRLTFLWYGNCDVDALRKSSTPEMRATPVWFWVRAGGGIDGQIILSSDEITVEDEHGAPKGNTPGYMRFVEMGYVIWSLDEDFTVGFSGFSYCGRWSVAQVSLMKLR